MTTQHSTSIDLHGLADAIDSMGAWFFCDTWIEVGGHLTCNEADALSDLLRAVGLVDLAEALIEAHSDKDEEGDDHFVAREERA